MVYTLTFKTRIERTVVKSSFATDERSSGNLEGETLLVLYIPGHKFIEELHRYRSYPHESMFGSRSWKDTLNVSVRTPTEVPVSACKIESANTREESERGVCR